MPESHEDIARVVDRDHGPQPITTFRREDTGTGPALCASVLVQSQLRSVLLAWKPGGTWGAWEVSRLLLQMEGWWRTPSLLPAHKKIGFCHMALKFNFKVTWTPQTIMIEEKTKFWKIHPKCGFWCLWPKCSFPYINSTHVENSLHFPHIEIYCQERLAIFPHILWCEERVSSHFPSQSSISSHFGCVELAATNFLTLFHTLVRAGKSNEKFLTFFQCVERSFPYINSTHAENSLLFPHFFLTFSSHWNFIVVEVLVWIFWAMCDLCYFLFF